MASEQKNAKERWQQYVASQQLHCGSIAHLREATKFSREGELDMANRQTRRTKAEKAQARALAVKCGDGAFRVPPRLDDDDHSLAQLWWRARAAA